MDTLLDQLQNALSSTPQLKLVFLFGSRAHGQPRPDSDIDLGVLADAPLSTKQRIDLVERVAQATGLPVDIVDLHGEPEPILGEVLRGVRLLGSSEEYARLLYRHVVSVADFLPLRERILRERRNAWIG
jgi:predicted nucleotidyltransferase